jgi:uncharacterized protein (DUF169 family)
VPEATQIGELLGLNRQPVGIVFRESPPENMARIGESAAAGCKYWQIASEGHTFYADAADHSGCPIGAHTHGVEMSEEAATELEGVVGTMVQLQYIAMEEVPNIPQLKGAFGVAVYAPLADAEFDPDVVLLSGNAKQIMLLAEAAHAAGLSTDSSMVGRPTCAAIPAVMQSGTTATNLGCVGNRVYTQLADDELYFVVAGPQRGNLVEKLTTIVEANGALEAYHQNRM